MNHPSRPDSADAQELPFVDLCALDDLPDGEPRSLRAGGRSVLLCRRQHDVFALADRCSHAAWELAGSEVRGHEIVCALHGARFDLRTGEATARPASKPLATYRVRIREGRVEAQVPPLPR